MTEECSGFEYRDGRLVCEGVELGELVRDLATPLYVYSYSTLMGNFSALDEALSPIPHLICFALKANSNGAILTALARRGSGGDVVSGGELQRALKAGIKPDKIVFAGTGKSEAELRRGLRAGILTFNVEAASEFERLKRLAEEEGLAAPVSVRVNPGMAGEEVDTHPYLATGLDKSKFGLPESQAKNLLRQAEREDSLRPMGLHLHLGSQLKDLGALKSAFGRLFSLAAELRTEGVDLSLLDLGGGLAVDYGFQEEEIPSFADYGEMVAALSETLDFSPLYVFEPGRSLVASAGALIGRVVRKKRGVERDFLVLDVGMNDFIRPSLYGARHRILPLRRRSSDTKGFEVVGPVCESADVFASSYSLPPLDEGDLVAIMDVGAYGFSMSSTYNSRPRPAEVMVKGKDFHLIRKRETVCDLCRREVLPSFLASA